MKRLLFLLIIPSVLFAACDKWLDIVPEEDMTTVDTDFETRDEAEKWHASCYSFVQHKVTSVRLNEAFLGADELIACDFLKNSNPSAYPGIYIAEGFQNSMNPYNDLWSDKSSNGRIDFYTAINFCNIFINKIEKVYNMEMMEKREWKAEVKALKAYYYFDLVRHYGPIILVPENIDPNVSVEEMKIPRSHVDTCFNAIVRLCDEAAAELPSFNQKASDRRTYFCKEGALALKARALAYQASDLFNGNPDYATFTNKNGEPLFSTEKDKEKWRRAAEAAEAAIEVCLENGKKLVDDQTATTDFQTHMLNIEVSTQTFNYQSDEVLWMVKFKSDGENFYPFTLPRLNSDNVNSLTGTRIAPTMEMVEMFYSENGLPMNQEPNYANRYSITQVNDPKYTDVVAMKEDIPVLHTAREPRFYADIAADRCYWRLGTKITDLHKVEAYQGENFGLKGKRLTSTVPENLSGYWLKKWICSKVALYTYTSGIEAMGIASYPAIRMAELYLIAAEAWNEYLEKPDQRVYDNLDVVRVRAGIPKVRDSWAKAIDKDKVSHQAGMREIIRQEWNIEFAFEGMRFWNLRRWKTAHLTLNSDLKGWNVVGNNKNTFYNNGKEPVVINSKRKFMAPRDYFWPIRSEEILISGCVQNPGW